MNYVVAILAALLTALGVYSCRVSDQLEDCQKASAVDAHEVGKCGETVQVLREDIQTQNKAAENTAAAARADEQESNERARALLAKRKPRTAPVKDAEEMNQWYERLRSSLR